MAGGPREAGGADETVSAESLSEWCGAKATNGVTTVVTSVETAPLIARAKWHTTQCVGSGESVPAAAMLRDCDPFEPAITRHAASS